MATTPDRPLKLNPLLNRCSKPSATLAINELVNRMWAEGKTVWHFGFGESRLPVHEKVLEALRRHAVQKNYLPIQGLRELREAIAENFSNSLDRDIRPEQVMVGPGSKSLIFAIQMALGSALILPTPSWVSYRPQAEMLGLPCRYLPGCFAENYEIHLDDIHRAIESTQEENRLLILNNPNNPSGQVFSSAVAKQLASVCRSHRTWVLSDEIYSRLNHGQPHTESLSANYPDGTIISSGLSKHMSLGGWRLGLVIVPDTAPGRQLMNALCAVAGEVWSSVPAPIQHAAVTAFADDPDLKAHVYDCCQIHRIRTTWLRSQMIQMGIDCTTAQGGFYFIANFDSFREALHHRGITTNHDLAVHLLDHYQIATLPGSEFGIADDELSLRIATSYIDMETDQKAREIMDAYQSGIGAEALIDRHHPGMKTAVEQFERFIDSLTS